MSVIRVAVPPVDGNVQMLPCRSTASVRPSGETATAIDVPSCTVTGMSAGVDAGAASSAAHKPSTPIASFLTDICGLRVPELPRILAEPARDHLDDLLAVEASVLDEDGAGVDARHRA